MSRRRARVWIRDARPILVLAFLLGPLPGALPLPLAAQEPDAAEREAVLAAVERFFSTMTARDPVAAREVLEPRGRFFSVREGEEGPVVRSFTNAEYLEGLAGGTSRQVERIWAPEVRIRGDVANVWAPYDFHVDGALSHCGVDSFDLVRIEGRWKITGGAYTVERDGCDGPPGEGAGG